MGGTMAGRRARAQAKARELAAAQKEKKEHTEIGEKVTQPKPKLKPSNKPRE